MQVFAVFLPFILTMYYREQGFTNISDAVGADHRGVDGMISTTESTEGQY